MIYLVLKVAFYLLLAALVGGLVGWVLRNLSAIKEKRRALLGWNEQIVRIEKERDRLQSRINDSDDQLSDMLREQAEVANEHRELLRLNKESGQVIGNLQEALQKDDGDQESRTLELRQRAMEAEADVELLRAELKRSASAISADDSVEQQARVSQLDDELNQLNSQFAARSEELNRVTALRQKDRQNHDKTLADLNGYLTTANGKSKELQQQLDKERSLKQEASAEADGVKQIIDMQQVDLRKRSEKVSSLKSQLEQSEQALEALQSQAVKEAQTLEDLNFLRVRLGQAETCAAELERALEESASEQDAQQTRFSSLESAQAQALKDKQSLTLQFDQERVEHESVLQQNQTYRKRISELKSSLTETQDALDESRAESPEVDSASTLSCDAIEMSEAEKLAAASEKRDSVNHTIAQLTDSLSEMQQERKTMLHQFLHIQEQYNKRESLVDSLQIRLAQAEYLEEDDRRTLSDIRRDQLVQGEALTSEIRELRQRLSDAIVERDSYHSQLEKKGGASLSSPLLPSAIDGSAADNHRALLDEQQSQQSVQRLQAQVSMLKKQQLELRRQLRLSKAARVQSKLNPQRSLTRSLSASKQRGLRTAAIKKPRSGLRQPAKALDVVAIETDITALLKKEFAQLNAASSKMSAEEAKEQWLNRSAYQYGGGGDYSY